MYVTYDATRKPDSLRLLVPTYTEFERAILAMTAVTLEKGDSGAGVLCLASPADCAHWLQFIAFNRPHNVTFILEGLSPLKKAARLDTRIILAPSAESIVRVFHPENGFLWNGNAMHLLILFDDEPAPHLLRYLWEEHWIYRSMLLAKTEPEVVYSFDTCGNTFRKYLRTNEESLREIFQRSFQNLHNETVKIVMFHHKPTSILVKKNSPASISSYMGLDVSVATAFANYLNFNPKVQGTSDKIRYGAALENGTLMGTIADLANRKADIAFNGHFFMNFSDRVELSDIYAYDLVCIAVPKAGLVPKWRAFLKPFDARFLIATSLVTILIAIIVHLIRVARMSPYDKRFDGAAYLSILMSMPSHKLPSASYHRMVLASCALWSLVVIGAFQGFLVNALTMPLAYPDINTLEELADSEFDILSSYKTLDLFPTQQRLKSKLIFVDDIGQAVKKGKAWTGKKSNLHLKITASYHVMKECPQRYYLSYVVTAGSPFLEKLDHFIRASQAAGLITFWENHKNNSAPMRDSSSEGEAAESESDNRRVFSLEDLQAAFLFLAFCHVLSFCVFVNEVVKRKCKCRKKDSHSAKRPFSNLSPTSVEQQFLFLQ